MRQERVTYVRITPSGPGRVTAGGAAALSRPCPSAARRRSQARPFVKLGSYEAGRRLCNATSADVTPRALELRALRGAGAGAAH